MSQNSQSQNNPSQNNSDRHPSPATAKARSQRHISPQVAASKSGEARSLPASMDEKADRLMDQVFGDIERMLERGAQLQLEVDISNPPPFSNGSGLSEPAALTSHNAAESVDSMSSQSALALLPKVSPRQLIHTEESLDITSTEESNTEPAEAEHDPFLELTQAETPQPEVRQFPDKLLMGITLIALLVTAGIWVFVRYSLSKTPATANVPSAAEVLQAKQEREFLTYVQRSMERLDRLSKQEQADGNMASSNASASVLDPLYVPLPPPPTLTAVPSVIPSPTARISVSPLPPIATAPVAPATQPSVTVSAAPATAPATPATIPNIAPTPTYVLIGLLELGDRSAALFEMNGAPQRIQVGEQIGSSGWALVSISGEEAIVRRNGEVRSMYIGQQF